MDVKFIDNSEQVKAEFEAACLRALEKCGQVAEGYAKRLCPTDTGNLRNSITHRVDEAEPAVYVGTPNEYAAYVELGTGKYYPGGRQGSWAYQDAKGNWHRTSGSPPQPYIKPSVADHTREYRNIIEGELGRG